MRLLEQQQLTDNRVLAEKGYKREGNGSVPDGRDGGEKGRPLGERREDSKYKHEERGKHNEDERAEEGNSSVPEW